MLFNSLDFTVFLPIVFMLYWFVFNKNLKQQNGLIVVASYFFYAWWDWRFLSLIFLSTFVDYIVGINIQKNENPHIRKQFLWLSIVVNLGMLGVFKYFNFFIENFALAFSFFGLDLSSYTLNLILPVGISFYTFQTLSYTLDIYKRKLEPTKDFIVFAAFVSFFPQLVAGPIERAKHLLPQFVAKRKFIYHKATDGLRQILWGLFKKMVIADNCALFADEFFKNQSEYSGSSLLIGAFFFTIQIYADFSGYSDIAIGTSRLFGFDLMKNFAFPYFSRNIREFWRRWHISLTSWFKDYFYIPIGGSKGSKWMQLRNTFLIFLVIGFWHGAHWKFIVYGFINALHFVPGILKGKSDRYEHFVAHNKWLPSIKELFNMLKTFAFLVLVRVFFRADTLTDALSYLSTIFSKSIFDIPVFPNRSSAVIVFVLISVFMTIEWFGRNNEYAIEKILFKLNRPWRFVCYYTILFCMFYFYAKQQQFIYFQF